MRKQLITPSTAPQPHKSSRWLDVETLAQVELSSEEPTHPIESALRPGTGPGWLAAQPGTQVIRLIFDAPVRLRQVYLEFVETETPRTQEFVLRWSPDRAGNHREIVRQQFNFSPPATTVEREEYQLDLADVVTLELELKPEVGRSEARASLARFLLA